LGDARRQAGAANAGCRRAQGLADLFLGFLTALLLTELPPWQRGTNENTNGLLRQYFPKGTDLARWTAEEIEAVAATINSRPRKTLGWKAPAEALDQHLRSLQEAGVASTDCVRPIHVMGVRPPPPRRGPVGLDGQHR